MRDLPLLFLLFIKSCIYTGADLTIFIFINTLYLFVAQIVPALTTVSSFRVASCLFDIPPSFVTLQDAPGSS